MSDCLYPALLLLTLLDLAFVGVTGAVPALGLAPLLALACASPWLRRLQRRRSYRATWNTGVLVVFAMLVHHASTTGLLHMLEDGLLLAVLCQVHLLNNVGARQRPDLVFFNSFLITFVTSFFAANVSWSVLFVLHALVVIPALELNVIARRGKAVTWPLCRALLRDSLPRTATIAVATLAVFAFVPRDFHHQGWLGDAIARHAGLGTGIDDIIRLDDERAVELRDTVVMRIEATPDQAVEIPSHWRGVVYSLFNGRSWQPQDGLATDVRWQRHLDGSWSRPMRQRSGAVRVVLVESSPRRLPMPLAAGELRPLQARGILLEAQPHGAFVCFRSVDAPPAAIEYEVRLGHSAGITSISRGSRESLLQLPRQGVVRTAGHLAEQLRSDLPVDADMEMIARHSTSWLRDNRRYQLPGGQGFAGSISAFAIGSGAGHCEYFATVLALLLRQQGVPCRLVGGYLAHERTADGTLVVRSKHAHAWVEALMPDGSWLTLDATPPSADLGDGDGATGWWQQTSSWLADGWNSVVAFDDKRRAELVANLAALPGALGRFALAYPLGAVGLLVLPFALLYTRRRQRRLPSAVVTLVAAARAAGLDRRCCETPRELLARARAAATPDNRVTALAAAVRYHEHLRYGGPEETNHEA